MVVKVDRSEAFRIAFVLGTKHVSVPNFNKASRRQTHAQTDNLKSIQQVTRNRSVQWKVNLLGAAYINNTLMHTCSASDFRS